MLPEAVTKNISVQVSSEYLPERSSPGKSVYTFKYQIIIANMGSETVQVLSRKWFIYDAFSNCEEVVGDGVVGEQPFISPGEEFQYESYCPLKTSFGRMKGHYEVQTDEGNRFHVQIPEFILAHPYSVQ